MNREPFKYSEVIGIISDHIGSEFENGEISYVGSYWDNPRSYEVDADYAERWEFRSEEVEFDLIVLEQDGYIYIGTNRDYILLHEGA